MVFKWPYQDVVALVSFIGPVREQRALRGLRDVSELIFRSTVVELADETLATHVDQAARRLHLL